MTLKDTWQNCLFALTMPTVKTPKTKLAWYPNSTYWFGFIWVNVNDPDTNHVSEKHNMEKVYFRSQILECPSIGQYWNIFSVPVLPENVILMFCRTW